MSEQRINQRKKPKRGYKYNWTFEGITKTADEWCEIFNVSVPMVMYRVKVKKMQPFQALITPVTRCKNVGEITGKDIKNLMDKGLTQKTNC